MNRLILAVLAALVVALVVAQRLGGTLGAGVLLGYLLGAGLSGLSTLYTAHVARTRPERALGAAAVGFLAKLAALLLGALAFRYLEPVAARADHRSFLIAFVAAVAIILPLGTWTVFQGRRGARVRMSEG